MADTAAAINLANGLKADRKLEMIFVNMGTGETEEWELLGRGVEDLSLIHISRTRQATGTHWRWLCGGQCLRV